jgi:hypothetical protein
MAHYSASPLCEQLCLPLNTPPRVMKGLLLSSLREPRRLAPDEAIPYELDNSWGGAGPAWRVFSRQFRVALGDSLKRRKRTGARPGRGAPWF